jgi:hypothetical protein
MGERERLGKRRPGCGHVLAQRCLDLLIGQPCVERVGRDARVGAGGFERV